MVRIVAATRLSSPSFNDGFFFLDHTSDTKSPAQGRALFIAAFRSFLCRPGSSPGMTA
jgi:hypothetical protein